MLDIKGACGRVGKLFNYRLDNIIVNNIEARLDTDSDIVIVGLQVGIVLPRQRYRTKVRGQSVRLGGEGRERGDQGGGGGGGRRGGVEGGLAVEVRHGVFARLTAV